MKNRSAKTRGRRVRDAVISIRLPVESRAGVAHWAAAQPDKPGLSEAIRRLVDIGLRQDMPAQQRTKKSKARASRMAQQAIDGMSDRSATANQRATRRRRLTHGPKEFRALRAD